MTHPSFHEKISLLESYRTKEGYNPGAASVLTALDGFYDRYHFRNASPEEYTPEDWLGIIEPGLSVVSQGPDHATLHWGLIFHALSVGKDSFPSGSHGRAYTDIAHALLNYQIVAAKERNSL